jgi:hypothetical protein
MAVTIANNRVCMTADDDVYAPAVNEPICSFTVTGAAASKSYAIHQENASGKKLFEYKTGTTPDNSFTEWCKSSTSGGLILITDDAGTAFRVFLNVG